jgi:hypothetical protein|tara:strand:+ start:453 stop:653 length:201 start_codon:yes stop_codon:yes gene_type:complete
MYTTRDYPTKKAFKQAVADGNEVTVYQPGGFFPSQRDGSVTIEGPHGFHRWYAQATIRAGVVVKVR